MREARIKIPPSEGEAAYHCTSRTVNREHLFDAVAKETLRRQLWQVADYCGVQIVTYTILSNHFHVVVHVPQQQPVSDTELIRRYRVLYPKPTKHQAARLEVIAAELAGNGPRATEWRRRQLALMGDVSPFMKLVKQRFSIWYNNTHGRVGTLWAERFKSTLVQPTGFVLQTMAAYVDLNALRAGLARDPKEYRFCGYAEAIAGNAKSRAAIQSIVGGHDWSDAQAQYRQLLFGTGATAREGAASIPVAELRKVIEEGGKVSLQELLRCRIRYFSDGAVLGTTAFVQAQLARRYKDGGHPPRSPQCLPGSMGLGDLATWRRVRQPAIG